MKSKRFFFILAGICVVLAVGLGVSYYFETNHIKAEGTGLKRQAADATLASEELTQLNDLKRQYASIQPVLTKLNIALPSQKNQSTVILQIQQLAANAGMKLPSASFQASNGLPSPTSQTVVSGGVLALPISFQLSGTYAQLQSFLQQLEQLSRYNDVTSLAITKSAETAALSFSITLNVYIKP